MKSVREHKKVVNDVSIFQRRLELWNILDQKC
jgi:hypothetical protein